MLYISKEQSAVRLEDGAYLHVYNPRLTDAPDGTISMRCLDKRTDVLEYTFRDGSVLSIHSEHSGLICADLCCKIGSVLVSISFGAFDNTLPSDPVVRVLRLRDRVVLPLLSSDADTLDTSFFEASFVAIAIIACDPSKNIVFLEATSGVPRVSLRETAQRGDVLDLMGRVVDTLEQAGVKTIVCEL